MVFDCYSETGKENKAYGRMVGIARVITRNTNGVMIHEGSCDYSFFLLEIMEYSGKKGKRTGTVLRYFIYSGSA